MKTINFVKYHGTGNDFVMMDNRDQKIVIGSSMKISQLCNRRFGIGADGLILIEESGMFDFKMKYYNADGLEGSMCGNGGRCAVAFASSLGMIRNQTIFEAVDGIHEAVILEQENDEVEVSLQMQDVSKIEKVNSDYIIDTGSPHYLVIKNSLENLDVVREGKAIRFNERYRESGINVNFVTLNNGVVNIRTYERGVEDETWSCGTGSVAAAIVMELEEKTLPGKPVEINTLGGPLNVSFKRDGNVFKEVYLTGNAIRVYEGTIRQ